MVFVLKETPADAQQAKDNLIHSRKDSSRNTATSIFTTLFNLPDLLQPESFATKTTYEINGTSTNENIRMHPNADAAHFHGSMFSYGFKTISIPSSPNQSSHFSELDGLSELPYQQSEAESFNTPYNEQQTSRNLKQTVHELLIELNLENKFGNFETRKTWEWIDILKQETGINTKTTIRKEVAPAQCTHFSHTNKTFFITGGHDHQKGGDFKCVTDLF